MIAFSFSRTAFIGLLVALVLAIVLSFFGGWLVGVSKAPAGASVAGETSRQPAAPSAGSRSQSGQPDAPPAPSAQPAAQQAPPPPAAPTPQAKTPGAEPTPGPAARPAPAVAPAPAKQAAPPAPAGGVAAGSLPPAGMEGTLPPGPLAQAMAGALERFGIATPTAAEISPPEKAGGSPVVLVPEARSLPREMNAQLGRLENAALPVYSVEVGTFTSEPAAERLYARLEGRRYDVYRVKAEPPLASQLVVSIRVGAYDQRPLADAAALELRNQEGLDARVVRVDPDRLADLLKAIKK